MTKLQTFQIVSSIGGKITGRLNFCNATVAQAKKYARAHSRYWKTRTVFVCSGGFPLHAFNRGSVVGLADASIPCNIGEGEAS